METNKQWWLAKFLAGFTKFGYWMAIFGLLISIMAIVIPANDTLQAFNKIKASYLVTGDIFEDSSSNSDIAVKFTNSFTSQTNITLNEQAGIGAYLYLISIRTFEFTSLFLYFFFLHKLFKNISKRQFFDEKNPRFLFAIGWVGLGSLAFGFLLSLSQIYLYDLLQLPENVHFFILLPRIKADIILSIGMLILGYIAQEAIKLYEEQKLTV